jgi:hypothetical protein
VERVEPGLPHGRTLADRESGERQSGLFMQFTLGKIEK